MLTKVWLVLDDGHKLSWKPDTIETKVGFGLTHVQGFAYPSTEGEVVAVVAERFLPTLQRLLTGEGNAR